MIILIFFYNFFSFTLFYCHICPQNYCQMINSQVADNRDSLDQASQQYSRLKSGYSNQNDNNQSYRHDKMLKNLYKQQLDDIMKQKQQQKRYQAEREAQQRQLYNERINYGQQAERMKDLSYKNYYQMLLNNQANITKNHVGLNYESDHLKDRLIQNNIESQKSRSQQWWESQQKRLQNIKKSYRQQLAQQVNQKNFRNVRESDNRVRQQSQFNKVTFTPQEVAKYERDRKLTQMNKYKQDLDKTSPKSQNGKYRVMAGTNIVQNGNYSSINDFNMYRESRHDPMTNPMPFNIQNPYILREFARRQQVRSAQVNEYTSKSPSQN